MIASPTNLARQPDFQRAFVALRYYFGARGPDLAAGLEPIGPGAAELLAALQSSERTERARALAAQLTGLRAALEQRSLLP